MRRTNTPLRLERLAAALRQKGKRRRLEEMERLEVVQPREHKLIPLLHGRFAIVDNEDFEILDDFVWHWINGYAARKTKAEGTVWMHRVITNCPEHLEVDHVNRVKSDNRRSNLRTCTKLQNQGNRWKSKNAKTSKYKGVSFHRADRTFVAYGNEGGHARRLGAFKVGRDAAIAYNAWASKYFGEFAFLNPV